MTSLAYEIRQIAQHGQLGTLVEADPVVGGQPFARHNLGVDVGQAGPFDLLFEDHVRLSMGVDGAG